MTVIKDAFIEGGREKVPVWRLERDGGRGCSSFQFRASVQSFKLAWVSLRDFSTWKAKSAKQELEEQLLDASVVDLAGARFGFDILRPGLGGSPVWITRSQGLELCDERRLHYGG
ncbi:unnamed protein product [Symbiodinium sp. CCMP2592]|nr:unnamed protein product [Symbiodinium sp. CCMP2592]